MNKKEQTRQCIKGLLVIHSALCCGRNIGHGSLKKTHTMLLIMRLTVIISGLRNDDEVCTQDFIPRNAEKGLDTGQEYLGFLGGRTSVIFIISTTKL